MLCYSYNNNNNINKLKKWKETFGGGGYIYGIDCGESSTGMYHQTQ